MVWLRTAVGLFILAHGFGHSIWFLSALSRDGLVDDWPWVLPGRVTITSPVGKLFGLLAFVSALGFILGGFGLLNQQEWWRSLVTGSAVLSAAAVLPWSGRSPGSTVLNAVLVDVALLLLALQPWSAQLTELS